MGETTKNLADLVKKKSDARLKRIWDTVRWDEETNQITFVTNEPEEGILDAYFAERKEREVTAENNAEAEPNIITYNYSNDGLIGSFASANGLTTEQLYEANPELPNPRQIPANTNYEVVIPPSENTPMITEVYYEPANKINLGSDAYLVVKGFALKDKTATIQVFEKSPYLLMETQNTPMTFLEYASLEDEEPINSNQTEFKAEFNDNGEAIIKIQLRPEKPEGENAEDTDFKAWQGKFSPPKQEVENYTITPSQDMSSNSPSGLGEFQLNGETSLSDTQLSPNGGYSLSMGNGEDDVDIPIIDPLWLLVKAEGNKGSYEKRFPETNSGQYFELTNCSCCKIEVNDDGWIINSDIEISHTPNIERGRFNNPKEDIEMIILHRTVSYDAKGTLEAFQRGRPNFQTGAIEYYGTHFLIGKDGIKYQAASLNQYTNHSFGNRSKSIGVEVVGMPIDTNGNPTLIDNEIVGWEPLTNEQTKSTACIVKGLLNYYDLTKDDIKNHEDENPKTEGEGKVVYDAIIDLI